MTYKAPLSDIQLALAAVGLGKFPEAHEASAHILEEAAKLSENAFAPLYRKGDLEPARLKDGVVHVTPGWNTAWAQIAEGGWLGISGPADFGGLGMPEMLGLAVHEMFQSANMGFALCGLLTQGAAYALTRYGSDDQKARFLPKLLSGEWTGTMNLTEPQAGSDLAALRSTATPEGSHYRIKGQKIFISYGDHEMTENILHLVLARLPDAPPGVKGISLFAVPKIMDGKRNDVVASRLEEKMGLHASPTCVMLFGESGGAVGELIGEKHRGLEYMFAMMNHARLDVGLQGLSIAARAYQMALAFAKERVQGKPVGFVGDGKATIIHHPDVRRLLVSMKARINAMRGLLYDVAAARDFGDDKKVELLTPVAKGWCTETANDVVSEAVQVFGGMGYIEETGIAQTFRDARILPIYEGTTAIQANALVGRALMRDKGAYVAEFIRALDIGPAAEGLKNSADYILQQNDPRLAFAASVPFLHQFGTVAGAAALRRQAEIDVKQKPLAEFYNAHVLPRVWGLNKAVTQGSAAVFAVDEAWL